MSAMPTKTLTSRWWLGRPPDGGVGESKGFTWLMGRMRDLQRVIQILHPAVEYPDSEVQTVVASSATTINSTSPTNISSLSLSFTPTVDTQLLIYGVFVLKCTALSAVGDTFTGSVNVNSVAQSPVIWGPSSSTTHSTITGVWVVPMMSSVTYTVDMTGKTSNVLTTFSSLKDSSSLTLLTAPNPYQVPS